jgi:hypothetical protein
VILGKQLDLDPLNDDFQYTLDLGLLTQDKGDIFPSNPIYAEVIIRTLSYRSQFHMPMEYEGRFIQKGVINMTALLKDFQSFWRENSAIWVEKYQYKEAAPHLILQAFMQRIINSGGIIHREFSAARGRMDLVVEYGARRYPVELKIRYSTKTKAEGTGQLAGYLDTLGEREGWLVIFDRRPKTAWSRKLFWEDVKKGGKKIHIAGC